MNKPIKIGEFLMNGTSDILSEPRKMLISRKSHLKSGNMQIAHIVNYALYETVHFIANN